MKLTFVVVPKNAGTSMTEFFNRSGVEITFVNSLARNRDRVSVAVARNPYTRCISSWKYCLTTRDRPLLECLADPPKSTDINHPTLGDDYLPGHDYRHFTRTQSELIFNGKLQPTHILRYETLEDDLEAFCEMYQIPFTLLHTLNVGKYSYTLTDQEREAIYEFYKDDFINLGYDK
jgi:hypothetical protein